MSFYKVAAADATVKSLLGDTPRIHPAGAAPEGETYPYATYQQVGGSPMELLGERPSASTQLMQVDVWAKTNSSAIEVRDALMHAVELRCSITSVRGPAKDPGTGSFRCSFDASWIAQR